MNKQIIIIGGIGNGTVIADAISDTVRQGRADLEILGFLNDRQPKGSTLENYPVLGSLQDIEHFIRLGCYFVYTIYRIDGQEERIALFDSLHIPPEQLITFVHPSAYVAPSATIGSGSIIMPLCAISAGAQIGMNCLLMASTTVGHNSILADHCHLAAQSCISSSVTLRVGVHIGLNATVGDNLEIGQYSTLGMGSVLLKNIPPQQIWVGNPARYHRQCGSTADNGKSEICR